MSRKQRQPNASHDQTGQDCDWENILLYPFSSQRLAASKDYPLDFVVYSATGLEGIRGGDVR